jgi:hypothetical protein
MNIVDLAEQIDQGAAWLRDAHNTAMAMLDDTECSEEEIAASPWLSDLARVQRRLADIVGELHSILSPEQLAAVEYEERRLGELADMAEANQ